MWVIPGSCLLLVLCGLTARQGKSTKNDSIPGLDGFGLALAPACGKSSHLGHYAWLRMRHRRSFTQSADLLAIY